MTGSRSTGRWLTTGTKRASALVTVATICATLAMSTGSHAAQPVDPPAPDAEVIGVPDVMSSETLPPWFTPQPSAEHPEANWATVAEQGNLNAALKDVVDRWTEEYTASFETRSPLKVGWNVTTATGNLLGIRVSSEFQRDADTPIAHSTSIYADLENDTFLRSPSIFTKGSLPPATSILSKAIAACDQFPPGTASHIRPSTSWFSDVVPQPDGAMVIVLSAGTVTPEQLQPVAIKISKKAVDPLLSKQGKILQKRARASGALMDPPPPPPPPEPPPPPGMAIPPPTVDCAAVPCIALTFDDGPSNLTPLLLDRLDAAGVKSTFFVIGANAAARPDIIASAVSRGHEVSGHSWNHGNLTKMTPEEIAADAQQTADVITSATGVPPLYFRPPYGAVDETVLAGVGLPAILWNVDTEDWKNRDVAVTTERALSGARPGAIILFHDIRETTVHAIPDIVAQLQASGYHLVTVSTLLANQGVAPGLTFSNRG